MRNAAPAASSAAISAVLLSAWRIPNTTKNMPTADRTAPNPSNGLVGSAGRGSVIRRLSRTITAMTAAWKTNAARQLIAVVMSPPISGPAAAPRPPKPLMTPNARARGEVAEAQCCEDVDGRDKQGGADALQHRVAEDQHAEPRRHRAQQRTDPVEHE